MQMSPEFHFMALPPEMRCHIYTFLSELVYKHVFPAINNSPVGTYCWPVYRMPTSLLLVSKVVHEETQDALVQTPLQSLNEHYPPTLVSGPYLTVHYSLYVSITLGYFDPPGHQYDHTYVSRKLA
jgi:hypothetical protein